MSVLDDRDIKALSRKTKLAVEPGDIYLKTNCVYRIMTYNQIKDTVLMTTTNDIITHGWLKRSKLKREGFVLCPLALLKPAVQIFELDEVLSNDSKETLRAYRKEHKDIYDQLCLPDFALSDVELMEDRIYKVPEEQATSYPTLRGKSFTLPVPFYCLTKEDAKVRYRKSKLPQKLVKRAMEVEWPVIYVPSRFE